jgi:8-oxo-(d)GTP phosphatase
LLGGFFFGKISTMKFLSLLIAILVFSHHPAQANFDWDIINKPNHFVLIRHALAPGTGDPQNFDLNDCATQRNLSSLGQKQAQKMGEMLKQDLGERRVEIFSSQWCRCLETARLFLLGPVSELKALNSFFQQRSLEEDQMKDLKKWLQENLARQTPMILVTHQVNITALTHVFPASGEMLIVEYVSPDEYNVIKRIKASH